jgi:hypothetical protein
MRRLTARLLLLFSLVGVLVPLGLAATVSPQTCCVRKCCKGKAPHTRDSSGPSFQTAGCCGQSCCSLASHAVDVAPSSRLSIAAISFFLALGLTSFWRGKDPLSAHFVRGPPKFSFA